MSKACVSSNHFVAVAAFSLLSLVLLWVLLGPGSAIAQSNSDPSSEQSGSQPAPTNASFSVDYTGALYGYYRIEPDETDEPVSSIRLEPPRTFLEYKPKNLLLGMGDSFSPEFGASVQSELKDVSSCFLQSNPPRKGQKNAPPEILYKNDDRMPKLAECDNVGRFLMKAGYSVIVPGKEDFLYSARWLRRMALLFRGATTSQVQENGFPEDPKQQAFVAKIVPSHKLLMLAANLRLNLKAEGLDVGHRLGISNQKLAKGVKGACPLLFSWDPLPEILEADKDKPPQLETCISGGDGGDTVTKEMDWLRRMDLVVDQMPNCAPRKDDNCIPVERAMNLRARRDAAFRQQLLENEAQIALATFSRDVKSDCPKDVQAVKTVLEDLSTDTAFAKRRNETDPVSLTNAVINELPTLRTKLKCPELCDQLNQILQDLYGMFKQLTTDQTQVDFLLSLDSRKAAVRLLLKKIAAEQKDVGYTIAGGYGSVPRTLVIGVIGKETMKAVSPVNLELCTLTMPLGLLARTQDFDRCNNWDKQRRPETVPESADARLVGTVRVGDPALAVTSLVRAAWSMRSIDQFEKVVVMAQMPPTEAEELAARVLESLKKTGNCADLLTADASCGNDEITPGLPHVDLIISEAQVGHTTPTVTLHYPLQSTIPVVSPRPAWNITKDELGLVRPVSIVTIDLTSANNERILTNTLVRDDSERRCQATPQHSCLRTMAQLLFDELGEQKQSRDLSNLEYFWTACKEQKACQDSAMMQFLMTQVQRSSHADVVLTEYRDFYFGRMLDERYGSYDICDTWASLHNKDTRDPDRTKPEEEVPNPVAYCKLRVALDRVLWKGDYSERVTVDGKTIKDMLKMAQQETVDEQSLLPRDTIHEWLLTFGIVTKPPDNLTAASVGPETFSIPGTGFCKPDPDAKGPEYCVNGQKISDDGSYGIATTDHLAKDTEVYKLLSALDSRYHWGKGSEFLTAEIADEIDRGRSGSAPENPQTMSRVEEYQQARPIFQLDYAKAVAGFMIRRPDVGNVKLGSNFSGVADSRATTPSAQEVDLEAVTRMTMGLGAGETARHARLGVQSDLEYDRAVTGSLTGTETVTYALNSFTAGGFFQYRLSGDPTLPRWLVVVAPYQYQRQIARNYLSFQVMQGPLPDQQFTLPTIPTRQWEGFTHRLGLRYEIGGPRWRMFDSGSYAEFGPEYSVINNILSSLNLPDGTVVCSAKAASFTQCLDNDQAVTSNTVLTPQYVTLHTSGGYWDVHLQKAFDKNKRFSTTVETKGDRYGSLAATLPTQTRYAFTTTGALNFAVMGNLAFSPTYTTFFYRNQGNSQESNFLHTDTFSITMKWYFARDAAVRPFWRQLWFRGPASSDQTKSAKMK